jgi:hypothetical protein
VREFLTDMAFLYYEHPITMGALTLTAVVIAAAITILIWRH